jgi:hypothetical protein
MKLIGRTLAILAAALVIVGILLVIGSFGGSTDAVASTNAGAIREFGGEHMQSGFNLGGIVQLFPTLAIVGIVTAIVAPIKQRLASKRRPGTPARRPQAASPAA